MKTFIGIDIGSSAIKIVELRKSQGALELTKALCIELDLKEIGSVPSQINLAINSLLSKHIQNNNVRGHTNICLAGQSCFIKFTRLPLVSHHKLNQIIKYEVQQQVPFPISEVVWDYQLLKNISGETPENFVLIAAAKNDVVNSLLEKFKGLNSLQIESIQPAQIALANLVTFLKEQGRLIILDIGARVTNITIIDQDVVFSRSILIAGEDITKAIAIRLNKSIKDAQDLKRQLDCYQSPPIMSILTDVLTEISQSISYFKSQYGKEKQFDKIILTGGSGCLVNIDKFLRDNLNIPVERISVLKSLKIEPSLKLSPDMEDRLTTAIGLAISGIITPGIQINLLPQDLLKVKAFKENRLYWFGSLLVSIILFLALTRFTIISNRIDLVELDYWRGLLNKYKNYDTTISRVQEDIESQKTKVEFLEDLIVLQSYWLDVFLELQAAVGPDMWYVHLSKEEDFLILEGKTKGTFSDITSIKEKLQQSKFFKDVQISSAKVEDQIEEKIKQPTGIKAFTMKMKVIEGKEYFANFVTRYKAIIGKWQIE